MEHGDRVAVGQWSLEEAREENEFADYLSRVVDYDDWMLNPVVLQELDIMWGPHTIDRFADVHNRQLERFNSCYWSQQLTPSLAIGAMITIDGALLCI